MEETNTQNVVITDIHMSMESIITLIFKFAIAQLIVAGLVCCVIGMGYLIVHFFTPIGV